MDVVLVSAHASGLESVSSRVDLALWKDGKGSLSALLHRRGRNGREADRSPFDAEL